MMNEEIMKRLSAVLSALNSISVSGKQNLTNLSGSISILEETAGILSECDINPRVHDKDEAK